MGRSLFGPPPGLKAERPLFKALIHKRTDRFPPIKAITPADGYVRFSRLHKATGPTEMGAKRPILPEMNVEPSQQEALKVVNSRWFRAPATTFTELKNKS